MPYVIFRKYRHSSKTKKSVAAPSSDFKQKERVKLLVLMGKTLMKYQFFCFPLKRNHCTGNQFENNAQLLKNILLSYSPVTLISGILMFVLFISELNYYLTLEVHPELFVDTSRGQKLRINIDIVFPKMACGCKLLSYCITLF